MHPHVFSISKFSIMRPNLKIWIFFNCFLSDSGLNWSKTHMNILLIYICSFWTSMTTAFTELNWTWFENVRLSSGPSSHTLQFPVWNKNHWLTGGRGWTWQPIWHNTSSEKPLRQIKKRTERSFDPLVWEPYLSASWILWKLISNSLKSS